METEAPTLLEIVKEVVWPQNVQERKLRQGQYKNSLLFIGATTLLLVYGRKLADLVYNQDMLEESLKQGFS